MVITEDDVMEMDPDPDNSDNNDDTKDQNDTKTTDSTPVSNINDEGKKEDTTSPIIDVDQVNDVDGDDDSKVCSRK